MTIQGPRIETLYASKATRDMYGPTAQKVERALTESQKVADSVAGSPGARILILCPSDVMPPGATQEAIEANIRAKIVESGLMTQQEMDALDQEELGNNIRSFIAFLQKNGTEISAYMPTLNKTPKVPGDNPWIIAMSDIPPDQKLSLINFSGFREQDVEKIRPDVAGDAPLVILAHEIKHVLTDREKLKEINKKMQTDPVEDTRFYNRVLTQGEVGADNFTALVYEYTHKDDAYITDFAHARAISVLQMQMKHGPISDSHFTTLGGTGISDGLADAFNVKNTPGPDDLGMGALVFAATIPLREIIWGQDESKPNVPDKKDPARLYAAVVATDFGPLRTRLPPAQQQTLDEALREYKDGIEHLMPGAIDSDLIARTNAIAQDANWPGMSEGFLNAIISDICNRTPDDPLHSIMPRSQCPASK